ncbi:MAG: tRNA (adenosine(37)-N6)-threonylcarbamoyltransferase complex ATPase subunit type 1 TsaE [Waddliaceae bacterium]
MMTTESAQETQDIAKQFARTLKNRDVICFYGDLGAGKTTFIKSLVQELTNTKAEEVVSPTFVYLNSYKGQCVLHHFDLYRLDNEEQFLNLGFDEFLHSDGIVCIEWPERIKTLLPVNRMEVHISHTNHPNTRQITIHKNGEKKDLLFK